MTIKQINEAVTQQETTHLFMGKEVREVFSFVFCMLLHRWWWLVWCPALSKGSDMISRFAMERGRFLRDCMWVRTMQTWR